MKQRSIAAYKSQLSVTQEVAETSDKALVDELVGFFVSIVSFVPVANLEEMWGSSLSFETLETAVRAIPLDTLRALKSVIANKIGILVFEGLSRSGCRSYQFPVLAVSGNEREDTSGSSTCIPFGSFFGTSGIDFLDSGCESFGVNFSGMASVEQNTLMDKIAKKAKVIPFFLYETLIASRGDMHRTAKAEGSAAFANLEVNLASITAAPFMLNGSALVAGGGGALKPSVDRLYPSPVLKRLASLLNFAKRCLAHSADSKRGEDSLPYAKRPRDASAGDEGTSTGMCIERSDAFSIDLLKCLIDDLIDSALIIPIVANSRSSFEGPYYVSDWHRSVVLMRLKTDVEQIITLFSTALSEEKTRLTFLVNRLKDDLETNESKGKDLISKENYRREHCEHNALLLRRRIEKLQFDQKKFGIEKERLLKIKK